MSLLLLLPLLVALILWSSTCQEKWHGHKTSMSSDRAEADVDAIRCCLSACMSQQWHPRKSAKPDLHAISTPQLLQAFASVVTAML